MAPEDFVALLNGLAPSNEKLESIGFTNEEAEDFAKTYECINRDKAESLTLTDEVLSELISRWDLSQITIGMIEFLELPQQYGSDVQLGLVETDPLVLSCESNKIAVIEAGTENILWLAAKDGAFFLDALVHTAGFLTKRMLEEIDYDDLDSAGSAALECAKKAGGNEYIDFYKMLLGV